MRTRWLPFGLALLLALPLARPGLAEWPSTPEEVAQANEVIREALRGGIVPRHTALLQREHLIPLIFAVIDQWSSCGVFEVVHALPHLAWFGPFIPQDRMLALLDPAWPFWPYAAVTAAASAQPEFVPALLKLADDPAHLESPKLVEALGLLASPQATRVLLDALATEESPWRQVALIEALTHQADPAAVGALEALRARTDQERVRQAAREALDWIQTANGPGSLERLLALVQPPSAWGKAAPGTYGDDMRQAWRVIDIIRSHRRTDAIEPLRARLESWKVTEGPQVLQRAGAPRDGYTPGMWALVHEEYAYRVMDTLHQLGAEMTEDERRVLALEGRR